MKPRTLLLVLALVLASIGPATLGAAPDLKSKTLEAWDLYIGLTEKRVNSEISMTPLRLRSDLAYLKTGKIQIQPLTSPGSTGKDIADGTIHHWLGAVFIPNTNLEKVIPWLQRYAQYQEHFADVEESKGSGHGDAFDVFLRLKRSKLGVTARFSTRHHAVYTRRSSGFVSSVSRSTSIREIEDAGTSKESLRPEGDDSGYLWRLNSYWRFVERDGGVVVECETIGLSRSLGLGMKLLNVFSMGKVRDVAESIAREALDSTLTDLRNGVSGGAKKQERR
jgi:hypothetical protein